MKYYIIAGEASGDLHGSNLMKAILQLDTDASFRFWGGDKMASVSQGMVKHIKDLAFMGFVEVIQHLGTIMQNFKICKEDILGYQPDVLVLIDYPGFNLRIAEWAKKKGIRVVYYISPQIWAWKENRVHKIKRYVDKMLVILPFEKEFYQKHNYDVTYVGHPLAEVVSKELQKEVVLLSDKPVIALLPGSRVQEIAVKLPIMLSVIPHFPEFDFIIAQAPTVERSFYDQLCKGYNNVHIVKSNTYNLLRQAKAALVTSGTATLETALFKCPEVVCYKGNSLSYQLARRFIKVKYISLVNLILDKPVVKELIQEALNTGELTKELNRLLYDKAYIQKLREDYDDLWSTLSNKEASLNAAKEIVEIAHKE